MTYMFFDQNIMEKLSKKRHTTFQNNVEKLLLERTKNIRQIFTPFSMFEFSGYNLKNINIKHKNKSLSEYQFQSDKEFQNEDMLNSFKKQIYEQITKSNLKDKLKEKKEKELEYLSKRGIYYIRKYIELIDTSDFYDKLIHSLFLDRISQINTSQFPLKDRENFRVSLTQLVVDAICGKYNLGSFRIICKIFEEMKKEQQQIRKTNKQFQFHNMVKEVQRITEKLKSSGDLVDCELVHLSFFGDKNNICHCYTTDKKDLIVDRLTLYCVYINFLIWMVFDYFKTRGIPVPQYERPEWKCGKVFILNRETGEKITKISVTKIYEEVQKIRLT